MSRSRATPILFLLEPDGAWAAELRRLGLPPSLKLSEVRTGQELLEGLAASPAALVAIAVTQPGSAAALELLGELTLHHSDCAVMIFAERSLSPHEMSLREAGAIHVVYSPRELQHVIKLAARYATPFPATAARADEVWALLPWGS